MVDLDDLRAWGTGCGSRGLRLTHDAADEIERLRDRLNLIATSPHADGWSKDRAKAALLDTP